MFAFMDDMLLWAITALYGLFGLFSIYNAYNILSHKNFSFVSGFDEKQRRNLKNEKKFAHDHALPHIFIGLSCFLAVVIVFIYGFGTMMYSIIVTLLCFGYGVSVTRRMPERLRRGRYM